jgi:Ni/Fe-hydrogenase 1 B-type cytochrome subunit
MRVLRIDIFLLKGKDYVAVGHNALAGFSYFFLFVLIILMFITGFGLYADITTWWLPKSFRWVQDLFGGDHMVREVHHICMWFFLVFIVIHLYLVLYHDQFEARGETSSMMSGYKFMEEEIFEELEQSKVKPQVEIKPESQPELEPKYKTFTEESQSDNGEPDRSFPQEKTTHHGDRKSSDG